MHTPAFSRLPVPALLLGLIALALPARAQNLLSNPGFEGGSSNWTSFIPSESVAHAPTLSVVDVQARSGRSALRLFSKTPSRFAFGNYPALPVTPGEHYRVSAWYRSEPGAVLEPGLPGFLLRMNFTRKGAASGAQAKLLYLGASGAVSASGASGLGLPRLPEEWTLLTAVVEVPENVDQMAFNIFSWGLAGALLVDDASVELVPFSVPATPLTDGPGAPFKPRPAAAASASAPAPGGAAPRPVALANPGFESGLRGWENISDSGMSRSTPEAAFRGAAGLRVEDTDTQRGSSLRSAAFPAAPGQSFRVNFSARLVSGAGIAVYLQFLDQVKRVINVTDQGATDFLMLSPSLADFAPQSLSAKAPPGAVAVQLWIHSFNKDVVVADFDEFELIENAR